MGELLTTYATAGGATLLAFLVIGFFIEMVAYSIIDPETRVKYVARSILAALLWPLTLPLAVLVGLPYGLWWVVSRSFGFRWTDVVRLFGKVE